MTQNSPLSIGWMNGKWARLHQLKVPISDRGASLGDGIFETILIFNGKPKLLFEHLKRWEQSASILSMATPPSAEWLRPLISEGIERSKLIKANGCLRLNWSRGDNHERGITIQEEEKKKSNHRFWLEINPGEPYFNPISTIISSLEKRNADSQYSLCKAFAYGQSIKARQEAIIAGYDEALLLSTSGQLSCGTTANLLVKRKDQWLTPPVRTGCLPGIMRQQGLDSGLIQEANINAIPCKDDEWLLINSLSCRPINKVNSCSLKNSTNPKEFWLNLLERK